MANSDSSTSDPCVSNRYSDKEFQSRCSSDHVCKVVAKLSSDQKDAIKMVGFGVFLDMKHVAVNMSLVASLVKQLDSQTRSLTIHDKSFLLTDDHFERLMGVSDGV